MTEQQKQQDVVGSASEEPLEGTILKSRQELDPLIRGVFDTFGREWLNKFKGLPLKLVPKKIEYPKPTASSPTLPPDALYAYRINVIPGQGLVYPIDAFFESGFAQAGEITSSDWNPNVTMQLSLLLYNHYDQKQKRCTGQLEPRIYINVWGQVEIPKGSITIPDFYISTADMGWDKLGTQILIYADKQPPEVTYQSLRTAISLVKENVLHHEDIIKGKRK